MEEAEEDEQGDWHSKSVDLDLDLLSDRFFLLINLPPMLDQLVLVAPHVLSNDWEGDISKKKNISEAWVNKGREGAYTEKYESY